MSSSNAERGARFREREKFAGGMTCPECGKICHPTRKLAKQNARRLNKTGTMRVYRCTANDQEWWHATSVSALKTESYRKFYGT